MVLVRLRQLRQQPQRQEEQSPTASGDETRSEVNSVFQWTIYFVVPRSEQQQQQPQQQTSQSTTDAGSFDAAMAVQNAFAVLRALMSGENMSFEEWIRLQEMMGSVARGVPKELIEEQLPTRLYTADLGVACPICLADYLTEDQVRTLPCNHSFHVLCIDTWLTARNDCPMCRQPPIERPTPAPS
jgi:hypothetical protein